MRLRATALLLLAACTLAPLAAQAQSRVYAKDVDGPFELVLNIGEDTIAEAENALERMVLRTVQTFFEELTIEFTFEESGDVNVVSEAFGSEPDVETTEWRINDRGQLIISEMENVSLNGMGDGDTVWMWDDGELHAYEYENGKLEPSGVSLRPIDQQ